MSPDIVGLSSAARFGASPDPDAKLRKAAVDLEATFLAQMLKATGVEDGSEAFGGGAGEAQFASFLTDERARLMAENGGIGLAQSIYEALKRGQDGA